MKFCGKTDTGKTRTANQDYFFAEHISPVGNESGQDEPLLCVVCDGMGGAAGGKIASTLAAQTFSCLVKEQYVKGKYDNAEELLFDCTQKANKSVYSRSTSDESLSGMGTTLTAALICKDKIAISNVGDSRTYAFKNKKMKKITRDHSYVQELVDLGQITEGEAKNHPRKNIITRALGTEKYVEADTYTIKEKTDGLLLCSDGLYNMVEEAKITELFYSDKSPEEICEKLIELANNAGGSDNITAIVVKF